MITQQDITNAIKIKKKTGMDLDGIESLVKQVPN